MSLPESFSISTGSRRLIVHLLVKLTGIAGVPPATLALYLYFSRWVYGGVSCELGLRGDQSAKVIALFMIRGNPRLGFDETVTDGITYQIDRVLQFQLLQDTSAMGLHGAWADYQFFGNLLVAQTSNK